MKSISKRLLQPVVLALSFFMIAPTVMADDHHHHDWAHKKSPTILDRLVATDGAQAVVAAVLVVDEAGVLHFSLAEILGNPEAEVAVLAPSNAAFAKLLGLEPGTLDGMDIDDVKHALPGLLPEGVGVDAVAKILLKHVALLEKANLRTASENALLRKGSITVADQSVFPVGIGASGVQVNYETTITKTNIKARNGVLHFIDTVIIDDLL